MAVFDNNNLYPDTSYTWEDFGTELTPGYWFQWDKWAPFYPGGYVASGSPDLTVTTNTVDLGAIKDVVPIAQVEAVGTVELKFSTSTDNVTFSTPAVFGGTALRGRYIKCDIEISGENISLNSYNIQYLDSQNSIVETLFNIDTSTLGGSLGARLLPLQKNFSAVLSISATAHSTEPTHHTVILDPNDYDTSTPSVNIIDLDSFGKVSVDAIVDIVVLGLPGVTVNNGNISLS